MPPSETLPLPCPFCGASSTSLEQIEERAWCVSCRLCLANGPSERTPEAAKNAWSHVSAPANKTGIRFEKYRLRDVAAVFNLILQISREGVITPLYQRPRYMAGLGIQLFTVLIFRRFHIQGHGWFDGEIKSIYANQDFVGFLMLRHNSPAKQSEIYLFAITPLQRKNGYAEAALRDFLASRPITESILVDCLPMANGMLRLLQKVGFRKEPLPRHPSVSNPYIPMLYP